MWFLSLRMFLSFIRGVACVSTYSFLWLINILLYEYKAFCVFTDQLMGCFLLAIMNNTAVKFFLLEICSHFFWLVSRSGIFGSYGNSV